VLFEFSPHVPFSLLLRRRGIFILVTEDAQFLEFSWWLVSPVVTG
jgi:hypothetical protein